MSSESYINNLKMLPHPEGGYYKEIYRNSVEEHFNGFEGARSLSTSIYFCWLPSKSRIRFSRFRIEEIKNGLIFELKNKT